MSNLIAVAYPDEATAREVAADPHGSCRRSTRSSSRTSSIAVRQDDGKIKLQPELQARRPAAPRAARCGAASSA